MDPAALAVQKRPIHPPLGTRHCRAEWSRGLSPYTARALGARTLVLNCMYVQNYNGKLLVC
jgi:hypothetical protein